MGENRDSRPGNLYGLVKAFLRDFYAASVEGTKQHSKGVAIFLSFVFFCFLLVVVAAYKISEQSFFCGVCHNMKVYVDSWKTSAHKDVPCIDCHYKPGFMNHLKGKWKDGQLSMAYFITGKSPTRPHAEIDDASCLQSGCHRRDDLKKPIVFRNVIFDHSQHLDKMKREKQLRCTTCHSQIVQGAHITVTQSDCFICHFYKTKGQKDYITGCTSCHFEAKGDIKLKGFVFNHKTYIKRGIACEKCHANVITGDGHIQENSCLKCHNKREILEAKYTAETLHRNHVTDHKVECFQCHSDIKHKITPLHYTGQEKTVCANCHKVEIHTPKVAMYTGKGGRGVEEIPSRMALVNMDCSVCHEPGLDRKGLEKKCASCHGRRTDGMVAMWKKNSRAGEDALLKEITEVKGLVEQKQATGDVKKKLDDAVFNYGFVKRANAVHNIVYASAIMERTKNLLGEVRAKLTGGQWKPTKFRLVCTDMCHGDIMEKKLAFGKGEFQHMVHVEGEDACLKCHSPFSEHGKVLPRGCSECHHGEGIGKVTCKDCHRSEDKLLRSEKGVHGKVACAECHSSVKDAKGGKEGKKDSARAAIVSIKSSCVRCHGKGMGATVDEWIKKGRDVVARFAASKTSLKKEIEAVESKEGTHSVPLRKVYNDIWEDMGFVMEGRYVHNPAYSEAMVEKTSRNIDLLRKMMEEKSTGKPITLKRK